MFRRIGANFNVPLDENGISNRGRRPKSNDINYTATENSVKTKKRVALSEISSTNSGNVQTNLNLKQGKHFLSVKDDNKVQVLRRPLANNKPSNTTSLFTDYSKEEKVADPLFSIHVDSSDNDEDEKENKENEFSTEDKYDKLTLHPGVTGMTIESESKIQSFNNSYLENSDSISIFDTSFDSTSEETAFSINDQCLKNPDCVNEMFDNIRKSEVRYCIKSFYMRKQPEITPVMRRILIDWIVEVAEEYELHSETLHLAISYIDAFLSIMSVAKHKLQLVGTSCLFIASKYEEIYPRGVKDFVYITDDTYSDEQVLKMEHLILKVLSFELTRPTKYMFIRWFCFKLKIKDRELENMAHVNHVVYRFIANFMEKSNLKVNFSHKYSRIIFCFINNIVRYKAASSVLQAKDIIQMVIDEVEGTNQLVESCRIYLSSELFITELECLAYFNHFVTFPFLNCVQISSQGQLLELLPKLHNDLIKGKIDTLQDYIVSIHGMPTPTLSNNLSTKIIEMMCATAASAVKLQCGREYGFSEVKLRATDLSLLSEKDLEGLPTNNLVTERDFSRFDREARVAKSRNRRFKAKNIQNNMVLYKCSKEIKIDKLSRTLAAILSCREAQWDVLQHEKLKTRLEAKLNKSKKSEDYTKKLLQNCKSWGGPCTSLEELQQILKEKSDQNIQIVKTELAYYAHTHKADKIANPELFRLNGISHEEKLTNFGVLLSNDCISSCTVADLPTNEDVIATLEERPCQHQISEPTPLNLNELCAYISELSMLETEPFIKYLPSQIALSSLILAGNTLQRPNFLTHDAEIEVRCTLKDLNECVDDLKSLYKNASLPDFQHQALKEKYKSDKLNRVAFINPNTKTDDGAS
ncbi:Cyclin-A2 [Nymphon striatum]|nr:Cyclin-A2 [Nymphon striatum]